MQLVRQEVTIMETADQLGVDRSTVMRIRTVVREGALQALAESRPGARPRERDLEAASKRRLTFPEADVNPKLIGARECWLMKPGSLTELGNGQLNAGGHLGTERLQGDLDRTPGHAIRQIDRTTVD